MSKHEKTLGKIFSHPINMNINWQEVTHLLEHLGAELTETHNGHVKVKLGEHNHSFHRPHHKEIDNKDEIIQLQHFLRDAGHAPSEAKN